MFTILCCLALFTAQEQESVNALVKMDQPAQHYYQLEILFPASTEEARVLQMPVWTPGSYKIRDYAQHLERFQALDLEDKPLTWTKSDKTTWVVQAPKSLPFKIRYRVFAYELSVRNSYLNEEQGYINPASVFLYEKGHKARAVEVRVAPPEGWGVASPLEKIGIFRYRAKDFDELVDSPFQFGNFRRHEFLVNDIPHYWIIAGDVSLNETAMIEALKKVGTTLGDLFGEYPFEHYYYFTQFHKRGGGGLEHKNNTMMISPSYSMRTSKGWNRFLGLAFHEYFHAWNVKAIRDKSLVDFDYQTENYTDLLWLHEGWTSYYDQILMGRAGFLDRKVQLKLLADSVGYYNRKPGVKQQSLAESSFNSWIHNYYPSPVSYNSRTSYYSEGAMAGFALDLLIRHQTNNEKSLDDVMRLLYKHSTEHGFIDSSVVTQVVGDVGGTIATDFLRTYVETPNRLPLAMFLEYAGLEIDVQKEPEEKPPHAPNPIVETGMRVSKKDQVVTVSRVVENSPAWDAGISIDDEILAINKRRVDSGTYDEVLALSRPGDQVDVLISRRQQIMTLPLKLEEKPKKLKIKPAKESTELEKAIFEALFPLSDKERAAKAKKDKEKAEKQEQEPSEATDAETPASPSEN